MKEEIAKILSNYASNTNEYLVDGAWLTCDKAMFGPIKIDLGNGLMEFQGSYFQSAKLTRLHVKENGQNVNGLYMATVGDAIQNTNIFPFKCNCELVPDRQWEINKIKENIGYCKIYGTCSQLMQLNNEWENMPSEISYFTYVDNDEEKEGINMMSMLFCKHGGLITPVNSGQMVIDLMEMFADFNIQENVKNGNMLAIKLLNIGFEQEKVNWIINATKDIYASYYIYIDPICLLSIIAQEGTGSFNTSSENLAADGQHGPEKNFGVDLLKANNLIMGKIFGYVVYGDKFSNVVNSNSGLLGVQQSNFAQYVNWKTPKINFSSKDIYAGAYAGHAQWHEKVTTFYESVRGQDGMQQYTDYIINIDKRMVYRFLEENDIQMVEGDFIVKQNGQDNNGNPNGTYTVVWESK